MDYHLYKSNRKDKKYMVKFVNPNTGKINTINFGAEGYSDYTINKDEKRKERYILRHMNDKINDPNYAGFYALNLLWNKPTLQASINDTEKRYLIKIYNNT
jgi:Family of unknown function (DUF5754)